MYALRLDARDGVTSDRVVDFCRSGGYDEYVVVHEVAKETGKPHFQGYVITSVKLRAYQARVRVAFPELCGNKAAYSASEIKDPSAYKRYIMKGTTDAPPVVVCSSIQLCIDELWKAAQVVEVDKALPMKHRKGIDLDKSVFERGLKAMSCVAQTWDEATDIASMHRAVAHWLVTDAIERRKAVNSFLLRNQVQGIAAALNERAKDDIVERVVESLRR